MPTAETILARLVPLFAPGLSPDTFRSRSAALLRDLVGCHMVCFAELHPAMGKLDILFDPHLPGTDAALAGYARHMAPYPCFNFDPTANGGKPFLRGDFLSDDVFYAAPIYTEGFALAGITDHAAMVMPQTADGVFFIGMELVGGSYQPRHRAVMDQLQPHLANAYLLALDFGSLERATADTAVFERAGLSQRQAEVLSWLSAGKSNAEIATILALKPSTVKAYVQAVFDKLGVDNRHAALVQAHRLARDHTAAGEVNPAAARGSAWVNPPPDAPPTDQSR